MVQNKLSREYLKRLDKICYALNKDQQNVLAKLAIKGSVDTSILERLCVDNEAAVQHSIENLRPSINHKLPIEEQRVKEAMDFHIISGRPGIFYFPSKKGSTTRLTPTWFAGTSANPLALSHEVRNAFYSGCWNYDIASSQLCILAAIFGHSATIELIKEGKFWSYLSGFSPDIPLNAEKKRMLKRVVYGLCYGGHKYNVKVFVKENGLQLEDCNLIWELFDMRERWFLTFPKEGLVDYYGTIHECRPAGTYKSPFGGNYILEKERWAGSLAATYIQSIEFAIMSGLVDIPDIHNHIVAWIHDNIILDTCAFSKQILTCIRFQSEKIGKELGIDLSSINIKEEKL